MRVLVGKIAIVAGLIYVSLILVDAACIDKLAFCQFYEPFSPW